MAQRSKTTKDQSSLLPGESAASAAPAAPAAGPPAGFRSMTAAVAPWALRASGAIVTGELLGEYTIDQGTSGERNYYQVRVTEPCRATTGKGEDREEIGVEKGEIVNLSENHKLREGGLPSLADIVGRGGRVLIWVKFGDKIDVKGGKTMWQIDVFSQVLEGPRFEKAVVGSAPGVGDDGTPF